MESKKAKQPSAIKGPPVASQQAGSINTWKDCAKSSLLLIGAIMVMLAFIYLFFICINEAASLAALNT